MQNPSSMVWVFAIQQQSGSRAVAAETMCSGTSVLRCWYLENVLISQLFFESPFPFLLFLRPAHPVQPVPGLRCCASARCPSKAPARARAPGPALGRVNRALPAQPFTPGLPESFPSWSPFSTLYVTPGWTVAALLQIPAPEKFCPSFRLRFWWKGCLTLWWLFSSMPGYLLTEHRPSLTPFPYSYTP